MSAQPEAIGRQYAGKSLVDRRSEQRERILLAARDVFAARGFAAAALDEIVGRARVSRTTFYAFFENKEECLLAVYRLGLERFGAAVAQAAARTAERDLGPAEMIRAEVHATLEAYASDPALARIVLIESVGATAAAEDLHGRARSAAARIIQQRLERYAYWRRRPELHRRVASLAAMAAIGEPISEFIARALVDPADLD